MLVISNSWPSSDRMKSGIDQQLNEYKYDDYDMIKIVCEDSQIPELLELSSNPDDVTISPYDDKISTEKSMCLSFLKLVVINKIAF